MHQTQSPLGPPYLIVSSIIVIGYFNKEKLGDATKNNIVDIVDGGGNVPVDHMEGKTNYQRGRLSIISWYLQAESLSDFFLSLSNNT